MSTTVPLETETREALCKMVEGQISSTCCCKKSNLSYNAFSIKESEEIDLIQKLVITEKDLEESLS
jgi:hypothetical protein